MADKDIDVDELNDEDFAKLKGDLTADGVIQQEPKEEPKEEQVEEPKAEIEDNEEETEQGKSETVPHGQFHRERERRKAAEAERERLAQNYQKLLERTQQLIEAQAPKAEEPKDDAEPDPSDPLQQISWLVREVTKDREERVKQSQLTQEERGRQEFAQGVKSLEDEYKKTTPDYDQALEFVANSRDEELQLIFPGATAEQRKQYILGEWNNVIRQAVQSGVNPAERIYQLAQRRGYKKAEPEVKKDDPVTEITQREEVRKASLSLGKGGGSVTNTGAITPEQLLDMDDAEFEAFKKKHGSISRAFAA